MATGSILDTLPQALDEWEDTKRAREKGEPERNDFWRGTAALVLDARKRRGAKPPSGQLSLSPAGTGGTLTLILTLTGEAAHLFRAVCAHASQKPGDYVMDCLHREMQCCLEARSSDLENGFKLQGTLEGEEAA